MHELFELGRYADAERELRREIASNPDNAELHAMLSYCLGELERFPEALEAARKAVSLAPDQHFPHHVLAAALRQLDRRKEALAAAHEALKIDPLNAGVLSLVALLHLELKDFDDALRYADLGLDIDPESDSLQNIRGLALAKLGRAEEAAATMDSALAIDPESSYGQASRGWVLCQRGEYAEAEKSFREALRLDAGNEWARDGLAETLKARNWFYRMLFRWRLWMATLKPGVIWGVVIGIWVVTRILRELARTESPLQPLFVALWLLAVSFVLLTWFGDPIANLLLLLHPTGKFVLDRFQRLGSTVFGVMALVAVILAALGLWLMAILSLVMGLLISTVVSSARLRGSNLMRGYLAAMAVVCGFVLMPGNSEYAGFFTLGVVAFPWLVNAIHIRE